MGKYLGEQGLSTLWGKIKSHVESVVNTAKTAVENYTINGKKISTNPTLGKADVGLGNVDNVKQIPDSARGAADGVATLDADGKLTATQLPAFKKVNGTSVVGSGDITIDLSLFKVVEALPTTGIDANKIYLVKSTTEGTNNIYTEYMYVNNKWEEIGKYSAAIDLSPYVKFNDLATTSKAGAMSATDKAKLDGLSNYTLPTASSSQKGGIQLGYAANSKNYPVDVDSNGKAYVAVPWSDTTYNVASASANGLMSKDNFTKLSGVAVGATADTALTDEEIDSICV